MLYLENVEQQRLKCTWRMKPSEQCSNRSALSVERLTMQNADLQAGLHQSRQQAANESAALTQEVRATHGGSPPQRGPETPGLTPLGVDTRLLGKPSDSSGSQKTLRDSSAVFKVYAGATVPKLQHLMAGAARTTTQIAIATILDDDDRICSGCC